MTIEDPHAARLCTDALYRSSFYAFVWKVFEELHRGGSTAFAPNWHIEAMCHELDNIRRGKNQRLVINVPPRHLKSITTAVAFPAFLLGHGPSRKIIVASYGLDLARKHSEDCRRVMESAWYQRLFMKTRLAQRGNTQDEFQTSKGGGRKAVSIGGAVTGRGCDYLIIDDLLKAGDAESETELYRAQNYIEGSLLSRFDDPANGRVVAIQQRLHEMDPAGYLLEKGTYRHLNLKAIAEEDERIAIGHGRFHERMAGTVLDPLRMSLENLERMRREMGSAIFNMQYQQNPIAPDGSPLRWEWFRVYEKPGPRSSYQLVVQSWDTAMSADPRSDFSVCTTWGFRENQWYLLDVFRDRLDFPDLKRKCLQLGDQWEADRVLIENAASGKPLFQECHDVNRSRFALVKPEGDKKIRFNAACAPVEEGKVFLPRGAPWLAEFKRELLGFPRALHDDQVDSFSQFLKWSAGVGPWRALPRDHPLARERREKYMRRRRRP